MSASQWVVKIQRSGFVLYAVRARIEQGSLSTKFGEETEEQRSPGIAGTRYRLTGAQPEPFVLRLLEPVTESLKRRETDYVLQSGRVVQLDINLGGELVRFTRAMVTSRPRVLGRHGTWNGFGAVSGSTRSLDAQWNLTPLVAGV